jgi:hypothetical protein
MDLTASIRIDLHFGFATFRSETIARVPDPLALTAARPLMPPPAARIAGRRDCWFR